MLAGAASKEEGGGEGRGGLGRLGGGSRAGPSSGLHRARNPRLSEATRAHILTLPNQPSLQSCCLRLVQTHLKETRSAASVRLTKPERLWLGTRKVSEPEKKKVKSKS